MHAVCNGQGQPVALLLTEGQTSDYKGAALLINVLPQAQHMLADRGYDSDGFREALRLQDIEPCIPPRRHRKTLISYNQILYRQRHKIENFFARIKDWRRVATRYDRCAHTFFSAICIASLVISYLN